MPRRDGRRGCVREREREREVDIDLGVEISIRREMVPMRLVPAYVIVYLLASNPEEGLHDELSLPPRCLTSANEA